ncbi:hypothetical protein Tco_1501705 [Tanacetum coccineum]
MNSSDPTPSCRPTKVEVPKELPKVNMVNTSLKKLKHHLAGFDVVVTERTTATAITEGSWGFEHTKACFRDKIIPFVKALKDLFNTFDQYLIDEVFEVQNIFHQMEQAVEHHRLESKTFEVKMNKVLNENERLLKQVINKDIVNIIMNSTVDNASVMCMNVKRVSNSKVDTQLNQEIFQRENSVSNQSALSFDQYFELNELKAQSQEKDTVIKKLKEIIKSLSENMNEDKVKKDIEEIETINIELDHREKDLVITTLKNELRKHKGKDLADNVVTKCPIAPKMLKIDVEPLNPRLLNNRSAHSDYLKYTQEEAELLIIIRQTCPSINNSGDKLVAVTPKNKDKRVRFTEPVTSSGNTNPKTDSSSNLVSNKPVLSSTGVKPSTSASGSQPSGNITKDKIQRTPSSTQKNKVEAHHRIVKSSLKNKNCFVKPKGNANVQHSKLNEVSELLCVKCNGCILFNNHDLCVFDFINDMNARNKSKSVKKSSKRKVWKLTGKVFTNIGYTWRPTSRTFTIIGNACPLTRITTTAEVPLRKPTALESDTPKPVVTLVYSRKPKKSKTNVPVSKPKNNKYLSANKKEPSTVKFGNDHVAKILGYGDYQIGNVTILRVYYVEGTGYKLFSVGQFYDSNIEVAFRQHTCFIRNLEGVDLLTGSRGNNLYTLSLGDMMAYQAWSIRQEIPSTPYPTLGYALNTAYPLPSDTAYPVLCPIQVRMTKVIKGEFEKIKDVKVIDVPLTCDASLEVFNDEVSRLSKMDDDLFTYEVEVANIPCDSKMDNDSEQEADDDMGYDPSDIRGDDEVELTDEESSDDEDDIAEVFRIDTNIFDYETPLCSTFKEFNYLLEVDPDLLTKDIIGFKTYEDYKDDWIYEWNKDVPWVDEKPWTDAGVWTKPTPVKHTCKPFNYKTGCSEWPTCSWKDDGYCNGGNLPGAYTTPLSRLRVCKELCEVHEQPVCNIRRYMMIKYSFNDDEEYVAVKEDEYDDLTVTKKEACRAYQEIFQIMDEGWMVTRAE